MLSSTHDFFIVAKKHMKTQWVLTILNLYLFLDSNFPKISKIKLSHVCGETAERHLFCFTSPAKMLTFSLVRRFPYAERRFVAVYCKTTAALIISPESCCAPHTCQHFIFSLFMIFTECACSPCGVKNSLFTKKHRNCECA